MLYYYFKNSTLIYRHRGIYSSVPDKCLNTLTHQTKHEFTPEAEEKHNENNHFLTENCLCFSNLIELNTL